jgi:hypothetical protein
MEKDNEKSEFAKNLIAIRKAKGLSQIDPESSDKEILKLSTRAIKKIKLIEQLSPENQRKALDFIKALIDQEKLKKNMG